MASSLLLLLLYDAFLLAPPIGGIATNSIYGWLNVNVHTNTRIDSDYDIAHNVSNLQECLRLCWRMASCKAVSYAQGYGVSCNTVFHFRSPPGRPKLIKDVTSVVVDMENAMLNKTKLYGCDKRPCLDSQICVTISRISNYVCLGLGNIPCGTPIAIENSIVSVDGFQQAFYSCMPGYVSTSPNSMTSYCDKRIGMWSPVGGSCDFVTCGEPPTVENAKVQYTKTTAKSMATYTCVQGYLSWSQIGMATTCQADGKWTEPTSSCLLVNCEPPQPVPNGRVTLLGQDPSLFPVPGQVPTTNFSALSPIPNSQRRPSRSTTLSSNQISGPEKVAGEEKPVSGDAAYHYCETGFASTLGNYTATCQANGLWSTDANFVCTPVDCGPPVELDLAMKSYNATGYQSLVTYTCIPGFASTLGNYTATCQANGIWSTDANFVCTPVDCGPPVEQDLAMMSYNGTGYQSLVTYTCIPGFASTLGNYTATCQANGLWSRDANFVCTPVDCGPPVEQDLAMMSYNGTGYQSLVTYTCIPGFASTLGNYTATCQANGIWSTDANFVCTPVDCGPPVEQDLAIKSYNGTGYQSLVTYTCIPGFASTLGNYTATCQANGIWSRDAKFVCTPVDCGPPVEQDLAMKSYNGTGYQSLVTYTCIPGFASTLDNYTATCQANGIWSRDANFVCTSVNCGPPVEQDLAMKSYNGTGYQSLVTYTCIPGFASTLGNYTATCQANGIWSRDANFVCTPVDCGPPVEQDLAMKSYNGTGYQSLVTYTCIPGRTFDGNTTRRESICLLSGQWSPINATCQLVNCPTPILAPGVKAVVNATTLGSQIELSCLDNGKIWQGDKFIRCNSSGEWSSANGSCVSAPCDIANGSCGSAPCGNANGSCGSAPCGNANGSCVSAPCGNANGSCVSAPCGNANGSCVSAPCGNAPALPLSESVVNKLASGNGFEAKYKCHPGYTFNKAIEHILTLYCMDGMTSWEGDRNATCVEVNCDEPPKVAHAGVITTSGLVYQSTAVYTCNHGYQNATAHQFRTCTQTGEWSGELVSCRAIMCGPLPIVDHSTLTGTEAGLEFDVGHTLSYECLDGHLLSSTSTNNTITCGNDGWSDVSARCLPVPCPEPPLVRHSSRELTLVVPQGSTDIGVTVRYTCHEGFRLQDPSSHFGMCPFDVVKWIFESNETKCVPDGCGTPPNVPHASLAINSTANGPVLVLYTCDPGYSLTKGSINNRMCTANNTWSIATIECVEIDCGDPPAVNNSERSLNTTTRGSEVNYTCLQGSQPVNSSTLTARCSDNGQWVGDFPFFGCQLDLNVWPTTANNETVCPVPPEVENAVAHHTSRKPGAFVKYDCNVNFEHWMFESRICTDKGVWTNDSVLCKVVDCGTPPLVPFAQIDATKTTVGSVATYVCDEPKILKTIPSSKVCLSSRNWSNEVINCGDVLEPHCENPPPLEPNAEVFYASVIQDALANYTCKDGFEMHSAARLTHVISEFSLSCQLGEWVGQPSPCIPKDCGSPPDVPLSTNAFKSTHFESIVHYSCTSGFSLAALSERHCQANGAWSTEVIECLPNNDQSCPLPPEVLHSDVNFTSHRVGSEAFYKCTEGFEGRGAQFKCMSNETWLEEGQTECQPIDCGKPPELVNTLSNFRSTVYGSVAIYECIVNSFGRRPMRSRCASDGKWSQVSNHECHGCSTTPPTAENAQVLQASHDIGGSALYACLPDFIPSPSTGFERTCLESGQWSDEDIRCLPDCGDPPEHANAHVRKITSSGIYSFAFYECDNGFELQVNEKNQAMPLRLRCAAGKGWAIKEILCVPEVR